MKKQFNCRLEQETITKIRANSKKAKLTIDEYLTKLVEVDMNPVLVIHAPDTPAKDLAPVVGMDRLTHVFGTPSEVLVGKGELVSALRGPREPFTREKQKGKK